MAPKNKKSSKYLVPVGTSIPSVTKLGLQALAESRDQSVYEVLQTLIEKEVAAFVESIEKSKSKKTKDQPVVSDSDLL